MSAIGDFISFNSNTPTMLDGLGTSNNSAQPNDDIDIATGTAMDSTGKVRMTLKNIFTKQIDSNFVAGSGNGGLADPLTVAANTWYHIFIVRIGTVVDIIFDTSIICANGVANNGVTQFRDIGSIETDGSSNIIGYKQRRNVFYWDEPRLITSAINPGTSAIIVTSLTPLDKRVEARISFSISDGNALITTTLISSPDSPDVAASASNYTTQNSFSPSNERFTVGTEVFTNLLSEIRYRLSRSTASTNTSMTVRSWVDNRGQL